MKFIPVRIYQAIVGVQRQTVYHWIKTGQVRSVRKSGRYYVEHPGDLDTLPQRRSTFKDPDRIPLFTGVMVCELVGVSKRRLCQLGDEGKINYRVVAKHRRYSALDVRNFIVYKYSRRTFPCNNHTGPKATPEEAREYLKEWATKLILKENP
jgi:hypothetical protein